VARIDHAWLVLGCTTALGAAACGDGRSSTAPRGVSTAIGAVAPLPGAPCGHAADGDETVQRHGTPCLCCHGDELGVAGSVDPAAAPVARVVVTAADGDVADMAPNPFANFFRHFPMAPPLRAVVYAPDGRSAAMLQLAPSGDCNACHGLGGPVPPIHGP
jgi:hypothetical protein